MNALRRLIKEVVLQEDVQKKAKDILAGIFSFVGTYTNEDDWFRVLDQISLGKTKYPDAKSLYDKLEAAQKTCQKAARMLEDEYPDILYGKGAPPEATQTYNDAMDMDSELENHLRDLYAELPRLEKEYKKSQAGASALKKSKLKSITMQDIERIYKAAKSEYSSSYAMMVDDSLRGAENASRKLGISPVLDWGWFPIMHRYVKAHRRWDDVREEDRQDMLDYANEELVKYASRNQPKAPVRGRRSQ